MEDFFKFRKMITPAIIQVLFWVGAVGSIIAGLIIMGISFDSHYGGGGVFLTGLLIMLLGPIVVRIYCELLIVFFRMNETLTEIKKELADK
jgi:hypothetical protein